MIETPTRIRVYQGFNYHADSKKDLAFAEASLTDVAQILNQLAAFHADAINDGRVFDQWGHMVTPKTRVDDHLLGELRRLGTASGYGASTGSVSLSHRQVRLDVLPQRSAHLIRLAAREGEC